MLLWLYVLYVIVVVTEQMIGVGVGIETPGIVFPLFGGYFHRPSSFLNWMRSLSPQAVLPTNDIFSFYVWLGKILLMLVVRMLLLLLLLRLLLRLLPCFGRGILPPLQITWVHPCSLSGWSPGSRSDLLGEVARVAVTVAVGLVVF